MSFPARRLLRDVVTPQHSPAACRKVLPLLVSSLSVSVMADNLFEDAAPGAPSSLGDAKDTGDRRVRLYPWDSVASQLFEPHGVSALDGLSNKELWESASRGNKKACYHSHLCADPSKDPWHVGAGISITAATLLNAIQFMKSDDMSKLLKQEWYDKIMEDIASIEPSLQVLNLGKGSQAERDTGSFRAAKQRKTEQAPKTQPTTEQLATAAKAFHAWLSKPKSALRGALFVLAGSNTFYAAHAANRVARAAVEYKPMSSENFVEMMLARARIPQDVAEPKDRPSDSTGLFEL